MDSNVRRGRFRRRLLQAVGGIVLIVFYRNIEDIAERFGAHTFLYSLLDDVAPAYIQKAWTVFLDGASRVVDLLTSDYAIGALGMLIVLSITEYRRDIFNFVLSRNEPKGLYEKTRWHLRKLSSSLALDGESFFSHHIEALRDCSMQFDDGSSIQTALNIICDSMESIAEESLYRAYSDLLMLRFFTSRALKTPENAETVIADLLRREFDKLPSPVFLHGVASAKVNQEKYLRYLENYKRIAGTQLRISPD
jgi:hypothetical protein